MPFNSAQLAQAAHYALLTHSRKDPIDQVNTEKPLLNLLMQSMREDSIFTGGKYVESIYISNNSNYQNYFGPDQVTYNERDPIREASWGWGNWHDGFWIDEDKAAGMGIVLTDDRNAVVSGAEKYILANYLDQSYRALKNGVNEGLDLEMHRDGSQDTKAVPGLDHIISTTPNTGTVGGINAANESYWRNNAAMGVTAADVVEELDQLWRATMLYGGAPPTHIVVGADFLDNYMAVAADKIQRHLAIQQRGGVNLDPSITGANYKGVPLVWDPTFEQLDTLLGAITYPWTKRAYGINSKRLKFRPWKGRWMLDRKPERLPDRYVHYFGKTGSWALTTDKRSSHFVMSIA